jgi:hypothetical protein
MAADKLAVANLMTIELQAGIPARSHARPGNPRQFNASEPATAKTKTAMRRLPASPMNQPIRAPAGSLIGPEPRGQGDACAKGILSRFQGAIEIRRLH